MFDVRDGRNVWEFDHGIHGVQFSDVTMSTGALTAGAHENHLLIYDLSSVSFMSTKPVLYLTLRQNGRGQTLRSKKGSSSRISLSVLTVDGFVHGLSQFIKGVTDSTFERSASNRSTSVGQVSIAGYD